jgi:hypothetical protein
MILHVFLALTGFGVVVWILGTVFEWRGIAVIGAVIVVAAGGMVMQTGLEYRSGQVTDNDVAINESTNSTYVESTDVRYTYAPVPLPQKLGLGTLVMLVGGVGVLRSLNNGE